MGRGVQSKFRARTQRKKEKQEAAAAQAASASGGGRIGTPGGHASSASATSTPALTPASTVPASTATSTRIATPQPTAHPTPTRQASKAPATNSAQKCPTTSAPKRPARPDYLVAIPAGGLRSRNPLASESDYEACLPHPFLRPDLTNAVYCIEWAPLLVLAFPPDIAFKGGLILTEPWVARVFFPVELFEKLGTVLRAGLLPEKPTTWRNSIPDDEVVATVTMLWDVVRGIKLEDIDTMCDRGGYRVLYRNRRLHRPFSDLWRIEREFTCVLYGDDLPDWDVAGWAFEKTGRTKRGKGKKALAEWEGGVGMAGVAILHLLKMGGLCAVMCDAPSGGSRRMCKIDPLHVVRMNHPYAGGRLSHGDPGPSRLGGDFNVARGTVFSMAGGDIHFVPKGEVVMDDGTREVTTEQVNDCFANVTIERYDSEVETQHCFVGSPADCAYGYFDSVSRAFDVVFPRHDGPRGPMKYIWQAATALEHLLREAAPDLQPTHAAGASPPGGQTSASASGTRSAFFEVEYDPSLSFGAELDPDWTEADAAELEALLAEDTDKPVLRPGPARQTPAAVTVPCAEQSVARLGVTPTPALPHRRMSAPASFPERFETAPPDLAETSAASSTSTLGRRLPSALATGSPIIRKQRVVSRRYDVAAIDSAGSDGSNVEDTQDSSDATSAPSTPDGTTPATTPGDSTYVCATNDATSQHASPALPGAVPPPLPKIVVTPPTPTPSLLLLELYERTGCGTRETSDSEVSDDLEQNDYDVLDAMESDDYAVTPEEPKGCLVI